MPQDLIIERWLDYPARQRNVIFDRELPLPPIKPEKNVIIEWNKPKVYINRNLNFSYISADPVKYLRKHADSLLDSDKIPSFVKNIKPLNGERLAADRRKEKTKLVGDVEALRLLKQSSINSVTYNTTFPTNTIFNQSYFSLNSHQRFRSRQNVSFLNQSSFSQMRPNYFKGFFTNNYPCRNLC
jgi:hypothetical protein